ncbi:MAG: hypothetical protein IPL32_00135 [Chloracidobacterium sp.]|nr:hypothetical protein [Chloracidobacterium sp.]
MNKIILRADAVFVGLAGSFGVASDLTSYLAGKGVFGNIFHQNPLVISSVEAHMLGITTAVLFWYFSSKLATTAGNQLAIAFHLICGISNVVWFDIFYLTNMPTQGFVVTILHFFFVALNGLVVFSGAVQSRELSTGMRG